MTRCPKGPNSSSKMKFSPIPAQAQGKGFLHLNDAPADDLGGLHLCWAQEINLLQWAQMSSCCAWSTTLLHPWPIGLTFLNNLTWAWGCDKGGDSAAEEAMALPYFCWAPSQHDTEAMAITKFCWDAAGLTCTWWSNHAGQKGPCCGWVLDREQPIKKGVGRGIHPSDIICSTKGWVGAAGHGIEYRKNYDEWWDSK